MTVPAHPPVPVSKSPLACACTGSRITTDGITVTVVPQWFPPERAPDPRRYCFAYRVVIYNETPYPVFLRSRRWRIVDAEGHESVVEGDGVIGEQPRIEPGHVFSYTSWCPLDTPWGTMEGSYRMEREEGTAFDVTIGRWYFAVR